MNEYPFMNVPTYLLAQNVHGPYFTTPILSLPGLSLSLMPCILHLKELLKGLKTNIKLLGNGAFLMGVGSVDSSPVIKQIVKYKTILSCNHRSFKVGCL